MDDVIEGNWGQGLANLQEMNRQFSLDDTVTETSVTSPV